MHKVLSLEMVFTRGAHALRAFLFSCTAYQPPRDLEVVTLESATNVAGAVARGLVCGTRYIIWDEASDFNWDTI